MSASKTEEKEEEIKRLISLGYHLGIKHAVGPAGFYADLANEEELYILISKEVENVSK